MEAVALLLIGAILGAVLSLACDRIYRRYVEATPCVLVSPSCSYSHEGHEFNVVVENIGTTPLPPYRMVLFNPHHGTIDFLRSKESSERLPHQRDVFFFRNPVFFNNPRAEQSMRMLRHAITLWHGRNGQPSRQMTPEEFGQWRLRLILTHSENFVLFEHNGAGAAIAEIVRDIFDSGQVQPEWDQMMRAHGHNSWRIKARGSWRRAKRRVRSLTETWNQIPDGQLVTTATQWWERAKGRLSAAVEARRTKTKSKKG
jgi:hypothetical protein